MSKVLLQKLQDLLDTGELLGLVDSTYSCQDLQRRIGYSDRGQYTKIIKNFVIENDIDFSHWRKCGNAIAKFLEKECPVCHIKFVTNEKVNSATCGYSCANTFFRSGKDNPNYTGSVTNTISGRLYRDAAYKHYGYVCNRCTFSNKDALEVHHKDRDRTNNDLSNLEVLCANCHAIEHRTH